MTKILVIEDDDFVRGLISKALNKAGYDVIEAANGNEGVRQVQNAQPDVVVTDILMPDKEGIETIIEIKEIKDTIKIIAMSGGGSAKNMTFLDMAKKVGAQRVLSKPFKPADLLNAIEDILNG